MNKKLNKFIIFKTSSIEKAIIRLNNNNPTILFVVDKNYKLIGSVTDGDIRRYILKDSSLKKNILLITNNKPVVCKFAKKINSQYFRNLIVQRNLKAIPLIENKKIIDILFEDNFRIQSTPVMIMAGGKGKRLLPLTYSVPKPLIKIQNKPMLQHLIENISIENFQNIFISINHFGAQIKKFLKKVKFKNLKINFIEEKIPLGTAGSIYFVKDKIKSNLIVINADIMTDLKLEKILNFHVESKSAITIGCLVYNHEVPFGVMGLKNNKFSHIDEKPIIKKLVNCGIYVINKKTINLIKKNENLSMVELIKKLKKLRKKISLFPMYENWIDVGNKENLHQARKHFKRR